MCKVLEEMYEEGRKEGFEIGYKEGLELARKERYEQEIAEVLSRIMRHNSWTLEQAMHIAGFPMDQKDHYAKLIAAFPVAYL